MAPAVGAPPRSQVPLISKEFPTRPCTGSGQTPRCARSRGVLRAPNQALKIVTGCSHAGELYRASLRGPTSLVVPSVPICPERSLAIDQYLRKLARSSPIWTARTHCVTEMTNTCLSPTGSGTASSPRWYPIPLGDRPSWAQRKVASSLLCAHLLG